MEQLGMDEEAATKYLNVSTVLFIEKMTQRGRGKGEARFLSVTMQPTDMRGTCHILTVM